MLQKIREGVGRWIAGVILGMIAIAFIFWGVDPSITGGVFAAKVNGEDVSLIDFERAYQAQQAQYQDLYRVEMSPDIQREMRLSALEGLIRNRALLQRVESEGYRISDDRLIEEVRLRPEFQVGGEFSLDLLRSRLITEGISEEFFLDLQREQIALLELQNGVARSVFITPTEFARYIQLYHQERDIAYATFEADNFRDQVELDASEVLSYYENNLEQFYSEESVDFEYIEILRSDIATDIEVTDEILQSYYEDEQYRFETEEERRARHILINSPQDDPEAEARALEVLARLESGEQFEVLAAEFSEDAGTSGQGGDLGWVSRGLLLGPFEDTLYDMELGEVQGPIKTNFGYHIIRFDEMRAGEVQSFDVLRDQLVVDYQNARAEEIFYNTANDLADRAFDAFDELESVAADIGYPLQTFTGLTRTGSVSPFINSTQLIETAFSNELLEQRENSTLVEIESDHVMVLRVIEHHLPSQEPLEVVQSRIEEDLIQSLSSSLAEVAAENFLAQVEELLSQTALPQDNEEIANVTDQQADDIPFSGEDPNGGMIARLALLATEQGGIWTEARWIERTDSTIPAEILGAAFSGQQEQDQPMSQKTFLIGGDHAVFTVFGLRAGNEDSLTLIEQEQLKNQLGQQMATYELTSYVGEVRQKATVRIPEAVIDPPLF
ncbi:MAG: SurA N-terminal domain-containing protein [Gammaproteobacteria bacterium]|nr:SurA N-terminal domain-containing protein [Gammaproteobacteria bacterium]